MYLAWLLIGGVLAGGGETRSIEQEEIRRVVEQYVHQCLAPMQQEVRIEFRSMPTRVANIARDARLQVGEVAASRLRGNVLVPVEVFRENRVEHTFLVSLRVRTFGRVLVAAQRIEKQARAESIPLVVEERETTLLPPDVLTTRELLAGMQTRQIIQRGAVLRAGMFEPIPTVRQGSIVTLLTRAGSVTVRTQAIVRDDARSGERVRVQKAGSHEILTARVIDEQTVELIHE